MLDIPPARKNTIYDLDSVLPASAQEDVSVVRFVLEAEDPLSMTTSGLMYILHAYASPLGQHLHVRRKKCTTSETVYCRKKTLILH